MLVSLTSPLVDETLRLGGGGGDSSMASWPYVLVTGALFFAALVLLFNALRLLARDSARQSLVDGVIYLSIPVISYAWTDHQGGFLDWLWSSSSDTYLATFALAFGVHSLVRAGRELRREVSEERKRERRKRWESDEDFDDRAADAIEAERHGASAEAARDLASLTEELDLVRLMIEAESQLYPEAQERAAVRAALAAARSELEHLRASQPTNLKGEPLGT